MCVGSYVIKNASSSNMASRPLGVNESHGSQKSWQTEGRFRCTIFTQVYTGVSTCANAVPKTPEEYLWTCVKRTIRRLTNTEHKWGEVWFLLNSLWFIVWRVWISTAEENNCFLAPDPEIVVRCLDLSDNYNKMLACVHVELLNNCSF